MRAVPWGVGKTSSSDSGSSTRDSRIIDPRESGGEFRRFAAEGVVNVIN